MDNVLYFLPHSFLREFDRDLLRNGYTISIPWNSRLCLCSLQAFDQDHGGNILALFDMFDICSCNVRLDNYLDQLMFHPCLQFSSCAGS